MIGIPTEQQVAGIGVDASQGSLDSSVFEFVHHRMTSQCCMVGFNVQLDVIHQSVGPTEVQAGGRIEVVLMLCRFFWLWLEQKLAFETDLLGIVDGQMHEFGKMIEFTLHVGVEKVVIALATAPEDVVFATQFLGDFQRLLYLCGRKREHISVACRCSTMHEARVRKHIRRTPQQFDPGPFLGSLQCFDDRIQVLVCLSQCVPFRSHVAIMKCIEGTAQFFDELEGRVDPFHSIFY